MIQEYSEEQLIAEATGVLGPDEPVLGAGVFGLQDLLQADMVGSVAGGLVAGPDGAAGVAGAVLGGMAATKAYAESQGATVQLVVAVTAGHIHVLNRDTDGRLPRIVASFERSTVEVHVTKMGLSRTIELNDPASGATIRLHGATGPFSSLAKGDAVVMHLLSA